jgi:hypothetical protein
VSLSVSLDALCFLHCVGLHWQLVRFISLLSYKSSHNEPQQHHSHLNAHAEHLTTVRPDYKQSTRCASQNSDDHSHSPETIFQMVRVWIV